MTELVALGIGMLMMIATWKWVAKPTYLDEARDKLFDLRDAKVRRYFLAMPEGLNHPMYVRTRSLINSLLRYTEKGSLIGFIATVFEMNRNSELRTEVKEQTDNMFNCDDENIASFCHEVREQASVIMFDYMAKTSIFLRILTVVFWAYFVCRSLVSALRLLKRPIIVASCSTGILAGVTAHAFPVLGDGALQSALEEQAMQTR